MSAFDRGLQQLLDQAVAKAVITGTQADALKALAQADGRQSGISKLTAALSLMGGGIVLVGIILLISANWERMGDWVKIGGLIGLLAGCHVTGLWLEMRARPYPKTAEALYLLGGGLFLGGIALVAQIYHLNSNPANGVLAWALGILPLAVLLRSSSLVMMSLFALWLWSNMALAGPNAFFLFDDDHPEGFVYNAGWSFLLLALAPRLENWSPGTGRWPRHCGAVLLFLTVLLLGFAKEFSFYTIALHQRPAMTAASFWPLLWLGGMAVAAIYATSFPSAGLRRVYQGLVAGVVTALALLWLLISLVGTDEQLVRYGTPTRLWLDTVLWGITLVGWVLHVGFSLWCVTCGALERRPGLVNAGVLAMALFILIRFFDLIGRMDVTGFTFILGGGVLIGAGIGLERWRRRIVGEIA